MKNLAFLTIHVRPRRPKMDTRTPQFIPQRGKLHLESDFFTRAEDTFPQEELKGAADTQPSSSHCLRPSLKTECDHHILDYDHPDKLFPYAGTPGFFPVDSPKSLSKSHLQPERDANLPHTSLCVRCAQELGVGVIFNEIQNKVVFCRHEPYASVRARLYYFGPNRFRRQDILHKRILSSSFYFDSPLPEFSAEPLCLLIVFSCFAVTFFHVILSSWFPQITYIKPPRAQQRSGGLLPKCPDNFYRRFSDSIRGFGISKLLRQASSSRIPGSTHYHSTIAPGQEIGTTVVSLPPDDDDSNRGCDKIRVQASLADILPSVASIPSAKCKRCHKTIKAAGHDEKGLDKILMLARYDFSDRSRLGKAGTLKRQSSVLCDLRADSDTFSLGESSSQNKNIVTANTACDLSPDDKPEEKTLSPFVGNKAWLHFPSIIPLFKGKRLFSQTIRRRVSSKPCMAVEILPLAGDLQLPPEEQPIPDYYRKTSVLILLRTCIAESDPFTNIVDSHNRKGNLRLEKSFYRKRDQILTRVAKSHKQETLESSISHHGPNNQCCFGNRYADVRLQPELRKYRKRLRQLTGKYDKRIYKYGHCDPVFFSSILVPHRGFHNFRTTKNVRSSLLDHRLEDFEPSFKQISSEQRLEDEKHEQRQEIESSHSASSKCSPSGSVIRYSFRAPHILNPENDSPPRCMSMLLSHFPLSSSELCTAESVLDIPVTDHMMPLNIGCLDDPVIGLNLCTSLSRSVRSDQISDTITHKTSVTIEHNENLVGDHNSSSIRSMPQVQGFAKCSKPFGDYLNSSGFGSPEDLEGQLCHTLFPRSRPQTRPVSDSNTSKCQGRVTPKEYFTVGKEETKLLEAGQRIDPPIKIVLESEKRPVLSFSPSNCSISIRNTHVDGADDESLLKPSFTKINGKLARTSTPTASTKRINTADEFLSDSEAPETKQFESIGAYSKSILSKYRSTHSGNSKYGPFALPRDTVSRDMPSTTGGITPKIFASKRFDFDVTSLTERELDRQRNVRRIISQVLTQTGSCKPSLGTNDGGITARPVWSDPIKIQFEKLLTSDTLCDGAGQLRSDMIEPCIKILTLSPSGELIPHFFRNINGVMRAISSEFT